MSTEQQEEQPNELGMIEGQDMRRVYRDAPEKFEFQGLSRKVRVLTNRDVVQMLMRSPVGLSKLDKFLELSRKSLVEITGNPRADTALGLGIRRQFNHTREVVMHEEENRRVIEQAIKNKKWKAAA